MVKVFIPPLCWPVAESLRSFLSAPVSLRIGDNLRFHLSFMGTIKQGTKKPDQA